MCSYSAGDSPTQGTSLGIGNNYLYIINQTYNLYNSTLYAAPGALIETLPDNTHGVNANLSIFGGGTLAVASGGTVDFVGSSLVVYSGGIVANYGQINDTEQLLPPTYCFYNGGGHSCTDTGNLPGINVTAGGVYTDAPGGGTNIAATAAVDGGGVWNTQGSASIEGSMNILAGGTWNMSGSAIVSPGGLLQNAGTVSNSGGLSVLGTASNTGTWTNSGSLAVGYLSTPGSFTTSGQFSNSGVVYVVNGGFGLQAGGQLTNSGTFSLASGAAGVTPQLIIGGTFRNQIGGTVSLDATSAAQVTAGAQFQNAGTVNNGGGFSVLGGATNTGTWNNSGSLAIGYQATVASLLNSGQLANGGTINIVNGTLSNEGTISSVGSIANSGTISNSGYLGIGSGGVNGNGIISQGQGDMQVAGTVSQTAISVSGGTLEGTGSLNAAVALSGGTLSPGLHSYNGMSVGSLGPGVLTANSVQLGSGSALSIDIGGSTQGVTYSALNASSVALGGTLEVNLIDLGLAQGGSSTGMFAPTVGENFDVIDANSITGAFAMYQLASLPAGEAWSENIVNLGGGMEAYELQVTSAVPVPAAAWLMLSGLGGLGALARKRKAA